MAVRTVHQHPVRSREIWSTKRPLGERAAFTKPAQSDYSSAVLPLTQSRLLAAASTLIAAAVIALPGHARAEYRSVDGSGNNVDNPTWGSSGSPLLRMTAPAYGDGQSSPAGAGRPGARAVSNALAAQSGPLPGPAGVTDFLWQWGQFLDHDIDLSAAHDVVEPMNIPVPVGDPFFDPTAAGDKHIEFNRTAYVMTGSPAVREQVNKITAYIDASNVYGSDAERAAALRRHDAKGRLLQGPRRRLPVNLAGLPNAPAPGPPWFLAGDERANEQVALTSLHTIFVREHNRLARKNRFMRWTHRQMGGIGEPAADDRYELARMLIGAQIQAITYNEFLPVLLGADALAPYGGYRSDVNAGIGNVFSTAAYRFGHTMVGSHLHRLGADGNPVSAGPLPLLDAFFTPGYFSQRGPIAPLMRGLAASVAQDVDTRVVDDLRNFLFGPPGSGGFDLAALNIQRGRDHGLPDYNQVRADMGLTPVADFAGITGDVALQQALADTYSSVDDVDVWVGGLAEDDRFPGSLIGDLFSVVAGDQFTRLRDGDRFWYQNHLSAALVEWVERRTLAKTVRKNTGCGPELPAQPFLTTN